MQFVSNGPDIPDALLQAHEEGKVVFFCGAGISYPAGLKNFSWLVKQIYKINGTSPAELEAEALKSWQFDATLDLLERRLPGQRLDLRRALAQALKPKLSRKGATDTHSALLRLARSRQGAVRLVTTNFDRIFHVAAKRTGQVFRTYTAPLLPIPKNSRWDGLVYLHGLLPAKPDDTALNRLVVTSGDFGLAYLTERWAARFVSELLRNYVVCFVGYSINDPVLRYMMDALAADRMQGESTPQAWALGDCELGQEHQKTIEWKAKGVTPILYTVPTGSEDHSVLHQTLHAWADTYRDGVLGKEAIVVKHALTQPQDSTQQDDFVGRMLWALSDKSGLPAKRFAEVNPVPPLNWLLDAFSDERFQHSDLPRFHVPPFQEVNAKLRFSLICRPAPYDLASKMLLAFGGINGSQWDDVMFHLARWLVRHLGDPRLIIWVAEHGGQLHDRWIWLIENELDRLASLERDNKLSELDEIRLHAPKAIPNALMRTLWRLLLSGRVKSPWRDKDLYRWKSRLKREGLTTTLRLEIRELLAPKVVLKKPFRWGNEDLSVADETSQIKQMVDWELVLAADHVHSTLRDLSDETWQSALPYLLDDFQQLLRDALDLLHELGEANDRSDRSHWDLPSITPHWQNRGFHDWVSLIELLRDAWLAVHAKDRVRASRIAENWFDLPYSTFKRLALFAASQDHCIPCQQWVGWLLSDDAWWLWNTDTMREVYRLFVLQGKHLAGDVQDRLEMAILAGPPREMYRSDLEADRWQRTVDRSIWLHFAKLKTAGLALGRLPTARFTEISNAYPRWRLETNERDEFSHWSSGTGDPDYVDSRDVNIAPRKRDALVQWLTQTIPEQSHFYEDTWRDVCQKHLLNSLCALSDLAHRDEWPLKRWQEALQAWSSKRVRRSWRYAAPLVQTMPDSILQEADHAVAWWLQAVSKSINCHEDILLDLCRRILGLQMDTSTGITRDGEPIDSPVTEAINHPIGYVTQALINLWFKQNPNDNDLLPKEVKEIFTVLCDVQVSRFRHARVLLGSRLIALFRVDHHWTTQYLLPLLDWSNPDEAKAVWEGFLWSPRLYQPLLIAFKPHFLDSANHYAELGEHQRQFATFLTYAALGPVEGYTVEEFRSAIAALPKEGLEESVQALTQALEGAAEQSEDYWKNRAHPFWQQIWPKSRELATPRIAELLSRLVIAARGEFPSALAAVQAWLQPFEHPSYVIGRLHDSGLCAKFPAETLILLNAVITNQQWLGPKFALCLDQILQVSPNIERDPRYLRLREHSRR